MNPRLQQLRTLLHEEKLDAIFVSSLPNIFYLTQFSDFTTFDRDGFVLVTNNNQYVFTHGIYQEAVAKKVKDYILIPIKRENPISKSLKDIITKEKITSLGIEAFDLKVDEYERLLKEVDKNIVHPTHLIQKLRIKKTAEEIQAIKKACRLGDKAFSAILEKIRVGITEKELAFEMELFIKQQGADISFPTIIAFGPNASNPHHVPTTAKLKANTFVLMDFGVKLHNYCSDMTRTVFFGTASEKQKKEYQTVYTSQEKAINKIKSLIANPKSLIKANEIDLIARNYILSQGYPDMPHSLGHGIGLDLHEAPRLTPLTDEVLTDGDVFSIEPGIYIPGKFGIRIEDLFAIQNDTLITLTKAQSNFIEL